MRVDYACFWTPKCGGDGRGKARLYFPGFFSANQSSGYSLEGNGGDAEALRFRVKVLDIIALVLMSNNEFPCLLERNVVGLTPVVQEPPSTDAEDCF